MENSFFLRIEIIIFFLSLTYIIYYLYEKIVIIFKNIKNIISPTNKSLKSKIDELKKIEEENKSKSENSKIKVKTESVSREDSKKIWEIIKRSKLNKSKWYFSTAKSLIIEWLSIDKLNKDLNLELASIYEEEKEYKKAEYIYNDLLVAFTNNFEVLKKLWYNLAIQNRYEESINVYTKGYNKNKWDIEIMEFLADLNYEIKNYKKSLKYTKIFLKQNPRNTEKLKMKWFCHENLWETQEAISTYKKVIELQPYNSQVSEKIDYLELHI
jgi:tetratricopeptide (TPR) repeat protein